MSPYAISQFFVKNRHLLKMITDIESILVIAVIGVMVAFVGLTILYLWSEQIGRLAIYIGIIIMAISIALAIKGAILPK